MKKIIALIVTAAMVCGFSLTVVAQSDEYEAIDEALAAAPYIGNELLVKVTMPAVSLYSMQSDTTIYDWEPETEQTLFSLDDSSAIRMYSAESTSWRLLRYPEGTDLRAVMQSMVENPYVEGMMPNYIVEMPEVLEAEPAAEATVQEQNQWYLSRLGISQAREYLQMKGVDPYGDPNLIVACVDAGIDVTHPALKDALWVNPGEIADDGVDNDKNGYKDDVHGFNFNDRNGDVTDAKIGKNEGHGTSTAGVIVAQKDIEGGEMEGIAPNVSLMACKVFGENANTIAMVTEAVIYAAKNGADIINLSIGIPVINVDSATIFQSDKQINALKDAIDQIQDQAIVVASAGNSSGINESGMPNEPALPEWETTTQTYPAVYTNVVGVMSENRLEDSGGYLSFFSMWDVKPDNEVEYEVMAPGSGIFTTKMTTEENPNDLYTTASGTSYSAPLVAGIFALMRTLYPDKQQYPNSVLVQQFLDSCSYKLGKSYLGVNDEVVKINYRSANAFRALTGGAQEVHPVEVTDEGDSYLVTQTVSNPDAPMKARLLVSAIGVDGACEAVYGSTEEKASEYSNFTFTCSIPKDKNYQSLRIMLWKSLRELDPLTAVTEIACEDIKPAATQ